MGKGGGGSVANNVYIRSDEYAWIPARLVEQDKDTAKVAIPQYESEEHIASDGGKAAIGFKRAIVKLKDYQGRALPLQNCGSDGCLKEVDDMVDLPYLHEVRNQVEGISEFDLLDLNYGVCVLEFVAAMFESSVLLVSCVGVCACVALESDWRVIFYRGRPKKQSFVLFLCIMNHD